MANPTISHDPQLARRNLAVLVAANGFLGSQMPMLIVIAGLAGLSLGPNICYATLPVTLVFLGSMATAPWLSAIMQRFGRKPGFFIGAIGGTIGALIGAAALWIGSFTLLLLGSFLTGIYQSSQGFFRFAAIDAVSEEFRPKAVSYVLAGGLLAAVIGPSLTKLTDHALPVEFLATYLAAAAVNVIGMWLFLLLDIPVPKPQDKDSGVVVRTRRELLATPEIFVAIVCAMVSYSLMTLMMTSAPLAMHGHGYHNDHAANVVSAHVVAMFLPSFFTGHLITRFGAKTIVAIGLVILFCAGLVALQGVELMNFYGALILLGVGWNFGFIGATTLLAKTHSAEEKGRVQGMNDLIVMSSVSIASLASGGLMHCAGSNVTAGWNTVSLAMVPFLVMAGAALIWLMKKQPPTAGAA